MDKSLKEQIIKLRLEGKSYNTISKLLKCTKANISYHCRKNGLENIGLRRKNITKSEQIKINEYYKNHTIKETSKKFNISLTSVKNYTDNKHILLTNKEKKYNNYQRLKSYRQKTKEKAVKYKGGKCEIVGCGYDKCIWSLEFHHKDSNEKDFQFSKYSNHSWEKVKIELDKCIMVCANCHREIHYEEYLNKLVCTPSD